MKGQKKRGEYGSQKKGFKERGKKIKNTDEPEKKGSPQSYPGQKRTFQRSNQPTHQTM
jgi:hypothetical protein